jgi:hypothetical protein
MNEDNQSYAAARRIIKMLVDDGVVPEGTMTSDQLVEFVKKRWGSLAPLAHIVHGVPVVKGAEKPTVYLADHPNAFEHQGGQITQQ